MKTVTMKRRLAGVEDIAVDKSGTGETFDEVFQDGKRRPITKLNASHIPVKEQTAKMVGASDVDSALAGLKSQIDKISGGGDGGLLEIAVTSTMTAADINRLFATIPRDLRGGSVTVTFPENGAVLLDETLQIKDVYNGSIKLKGNLCTLGNSIDGTVSTPGIVLFRMNCRCFIEIEKLTFSPDASTAQTPVIELSNAAFSMNECVFSLANGVRQIGLKASSVSGTVLSTSYNGMKTANLITDNSTVSFVNCYGGINVTTAYEIKNSHSSITQNRLSGLVKSDNIAGGNPAGTVIAFAGGVPPDGYLLCDGRILQKADYPNLAVVIGNTYGGAGVEFKLPDLRAEFIRGADSGRGIDTELEVGKWKDCAVEAGGTHELNKSGSAYFPGIDVNGACRIETTNGNGVLTGSRNALGLLKLQEGVVTGFPNDNNVLTVTVKDSISRDGTRKTAKETRPRAVAMLYCIKY